MDNLYPQIDREPAPRKKKNQNKTNEGQIWMQVKSAKVSYKRKNNYFYSYTYIKNIKEWQFPW